MDADIREKMKLRLGRISGLVALFEHSTWREGKMLKPCGSLNDLDGSETTFLVRSTAVVMKLAACAYIVD